MFKLSSVIVVTLVLTFVWLAEGLKCRACEPENCTPPAGCKWGTGLGVCQCCSVCLKGPGEQCGGPWHIHGQCGSSLECILDEPAVENGAGVCDRPGVGIIRP
ncbi:single insulin-like growth factor-binding domain protein-2 [Hyalella azteca]|uniref:Single insulin-like growth factor-binding domain protein-2 n=1 Tax=Hyalella azteca TaxID=294128 RepID=A0A8B7N556_HYAAZ|nr:single insulin-like growth factor-binding domain protein-2 [Hyalella azteca]